VSSKTLDLFQSDSGILQVIQLIFVRTCPDICPIAPIPSAHYNGHVMLNLRRIVQGITLFLTLAMMVGTGAERKVTNLDVPGGSTTVARGINSRGDVVGYWFNHSNGQGAITHGFVRKEGSYVTIDVPGAFGGTIASGINDRGDLVGGYYDGQEPSLRDTSRQ